MENNDFLKDKKEMKLFAKLGSKHNIKGMWIMLESGTDFHWFQDISTRHRLIVTAKVQEKLIEQEIEELAMKDSGKAINNKKDTDYFG